MKIYISGPITGTSDYMERFAAAEKRLQQEGHVVVNPARVSGELPEGTSQSEYMSISICMLDMCEGIFMMRNWERSRGANMEFEHAVKTRKVITFEQ